MHGHPGRSGVWPVASGVSANTDIMITDSTCKHLYNCTCKSKYGVLEIAHGNWYPVNIVSNYGVGRCPSIDVWFKGISASILVCNHFTMQLWVVIVVNAEVFWFIPWACPSTCPLWKWDFPPCLRTLLVGISHVEVGNMCPSSSTIAATHPVHVTRRSALQPHWSSWPSSSQSSS